MKIVIIVLILIIAVFVIFTVRGSLTADPPKSGGRDETVKFIKERKTPGWSKMIKNLLSSMGKKMSLPCDKPAPEKADFQCAALSLNKDLNIPAENGTKFRTATFILFKGTAHIQYRDRTSNADDFKLDEQDFDLPNTDTEDPKIGSIVALTDGGILRISCIGNQLCQVGQQ